MIVPSLEHKMIEPSLKHKIIIFHTLTANRTTVIKTPKHAKNQKLVKFNHRQPTKKQKEKEEQTAFQIVPFISKEKNESF